MGSRAEAGPSSAAGGHGHLGLCRALYSFHGEREGDLSFQAGEVIRVIQKNPRWWAGITADGRTGVFPSNYVDVIQDEELAAFHYISPPDPKTKPDARVQGSNINLGAAPLPPSQSTSTLSSTSSIHQNNDDDDDIQARLNRLKSGAASPQFRKSYRVSQLLAWDEVSGEALTPGLTSQEQTVVPPTPKPKAKKYFDEVAQLQAIRNQYVHSIMPLLQAKAKEFDVLAEDYFNKLRITALQSGVASDIVQKLMDAEKDRVKLVSWSLFHHEALDMHPLESNISERTQVLETEQCIITAQSYVRRWLVRRQYAAELKLRRQRRRCALEIVKTERSYVRSLQIIVERFMAPLEQTGLISADDKANLFSNVTLILGVNQTILKQLEERTSEWSYNSCLGDVFLALSPFLRMYTTYINNYNQSAETYQRLLQQPAFAQMIENCRAHPDVNKLAFHDFQIMPVQRIPRYVLLVVELLKYTPEGHPDHTELTKALALLREVANKINEHRRWSESMQKLIEIQRSITGFSEELVQPSRWLVHEGSVTRTARGGHSGGSTCYLFLFNDILVITERKRYMFEDKHYYIFKEQISLNNMSSGNLEGSSNGFVLRTKYGVVESFLAENAEQKDKWIRLLENVIDELHKNRATLKLDSSLSLSSSSSLVDTRRNSTYVTSESEGEATKDDQQSLIATLSSLSVPTKAARPASPLNVSTPPLSPHPSALSPQHHSSPPLAATSTLGEVVNLLNEALALEREIFQRPIEIQSIMPDYCRSIHPQHLQMLGDRLRLLHSKLNDIRIAQQKIKTFLLKDEPIKGVQNLDTLIKEGRVSIGDLKVWIQQAFPAGSTVYGAVPQPAGPRAMMAALLKWYLSLSDSWTSLLSQPFPS